MLSEVGALGCFGLSIATNRNFKRLEAFRVQPGFPTSDWRLFLYSFVENFKTHVTIKNYSGYSALVLLCQFGSQT